MRAPCSELYLLPTTTSALATTIASTNGTNMPPTLSPSPSLKPTIHSPSPTLPPPFPPTKSPQTNQHGKVFSNSSSSGSALGSFESVAMYSGRLSGASGESAG